MRGLSFSQTHPHLTRSKSGGREERTQAGRSLCQSRVPSWPRRALREVGRASRVLLTLGLKGSRTRFSCSFPSREPVPRARPSGLRREEACVRGHRSLQGLPPSLHLAALLAPGSRDGEGVVLPGVGAGLAWAGALAASQGPPSGSTQA